MRKGYRKKTDRKEKGAMILKQLDQISLVGRVSGVAVEALSESILTSPGSRDAKEDLKDGVCKLLQVLLMDTVMAANEEKDLLEDVVAKMEKWNVSDLEEYVWTESVEPAKKLFKDFEVRPFGEQVYIFSVAQEKMLSFWYQYSWAKTRDDLWDAAEDKDASAVMKLAERINEDTHKIDSGMEESEDILLRSMILYVALDNTLPDSWKTMAYVYMRLSEDGLSWVNNHISNLEREHPARQLFASHFTARNMAAQFGLLKKLENLDENPRREESLACGANENVKVKAEQAAEKMLGYGKATLSVTAQSLLKAVILYVITDDALPPEKKTLSQVATYLREWGPNGAAVILSQLPVSHPARMAFRIYENSWGKRKAAYQEIMLRMQGNKGMNKAYPA